MENCDNWKCALGCADNNFTKRVYNPDNADFNGTDKIYTRRIDVERDGTKNQKAHDKFVEHKLSRNVDFNSCHSLWRTRSIDLKPVTLDKTEIYYAVAISAMIINFGVVGWRLVEILTYDIHVPVEFDKNDSEWKPIWQSDSKLLSSWKVFKMVSCLFSCFADSLFDALYFIKLKTVPRLIHVPARIHVIQGGLLYLGELLSLLEIVKILSHFQGYDRSSSRSENYGRSRQR